MKEERNYTDICIEYFNEQPPGAFSLRDYIDYVNYQIAVLDLDISNLFDKNCAADLYESQTALIRFHYRLKNKMVAKELRAALQSRGEGL